MSGSKISLRQRAGLELWRLIRRQKGLKHELTTLFWECTLRCNLACKHCGSDCKSAPAVREMDAETFLSVIDRLTPHIDPHKLLIIFTGGEALLRPDLECCGLELYHRGYPWSIVTNGMLLDAKRRDSLLAAGLHALTISLDGFEDAHNYLRGHPKSYAKALNAAKLMAEVEDIAWDIVTCVNPMNIGYLLEFRDMLVDLGLKEWRLFTIFPVGRAANDPNLQLSDCDFYRLMEFIRDTNAQGDISASYGCEGYLGGFEGEARKNFYECYAGIHTASILCDGTISACPSIRSNYYQGNVHQDDLWQVWQNGFRAYRDREWMHQRSPCKDCKSWRYCEGNGMHLRNDDGQLLLCHLNRIRRAEQKR